MLRTSISAILASFCALLSSLFTAPAQAAPASRPASQGPKAKAPTSRPAPRRALKPASRPAAKASPTGGFVRATAWDVGLDPRLVSRLVKQAKAAGSDSFLILRSGKLVGHWTFGRPIGPIETMSVTKSLVGLAIGKLIDEKKIKSLDTPVHTFFPKAADWKKSPKAQVTLKHLLTHTSGLKTGRNTRKIYASGDFVKYALKGRLVSLPGDRFRYNNRAVNLLAGIVKRASGLRLDRYMQQKIFTPMGIPKVAWTLDKAGNPHAMSGAKLTAIDLAKIGEMMRLGGVFRGKRILSKAWVDRSVTPHPHKLRRWGRASHGLLWWLLPAPYTEAITPALFAKWGKAGMNPQWLRKLKPLLGKKYHTPVGRYFATRRKIYHALKNALGRDFRGFRRFLKRHKLSRMARTYGTQKGFCAQGYLGQHLIVLPQAEIVIVRQIRYRRGLDRFKTGMNTLARGLSRHDFWPAKTPKARKQLEQLYQLGLSAATSKKPPTKALQQAAALVAHKSPLVQDLAIWALGEYGKHAAFAEPLLLAKLNPKLDDRMAEVIWLALGKLGAKKSIKAAMALLTDEKASLSHRRVAAKSLGLLAARDLAIVEPSLKLLGEIRSWAVRKSLAQGLVAVGPVMLPRLLVIWKRPKDKRRRQVVEIITKLKLPDAQMVRFCMAMLRDRDWSIRRKGRRKLVSMGAKAKAALPFFAQMAKRSGGWQARVWRRAHFLLRSAVLQAEYEKAKQAKKAKKTKKRQKPKQRPAARPVKKPTSKPVSKTQKKSSVRKTGRK